MKTTWSKWLLRLWLAAGPILLFCFLYINRDFEPLKLYSSVQKLQAQELSSGRLLDKLPEIFPLEPALAVLLLADPDGNFQGGIYEPGRIQPQIYRRIVNQLQAEKFQAEKSGLMLSQLGFQMLRYTLSDQRTLFLVAKNDVSLLNSWLRLHQQQPLLPAFIIIYSLISLFAYFYAQGPDKIAPREHKKPRKFKLDNLPSMRFFSNKRQKPMAKLNPVAGAESQGELNLFENQLQQFLHEVDRISRAKRLIFFFKEQNKWKLEREKSGQLLIKTDENYDLNQFWPALSSHENWQEPLISMDRVKSLVPVRRRDQVTGCLLIEKFPKEMITDRELKQIEPIAEAFARSLYIQRTYERAVLDPDTGFYTYPFFLFSLKERLISGRNFMVFVFEIENFQDLENELMSRFARYTQLQKNDYFHTDSSSLCRLDINSFAVITEANDPAAISNIKDFANSLKEYSSEHFHLDLTGAIVSAGNDSPNVDVVLRWLKQALQASRQLDRVEPFLPDTLSAVS